MTPVRDERGFTLTEVLVVMALFGLFASIFYSVMLAGRRGATTAQNIATVSQEARLGFNRMIRDTREAMAGTGLVSATATSYRIRVDFDGNGTIDPTQFEDVTFAYEAPNRRVTISNGTVTETLIDGVDPVPGRDMFTYTSNLLQYDTSPVGGDGFTTIAELEAAAAAGASLAADKLQYISTVGYALRISSGASSTDFFAHATLRSRR